MIAGFFDSPAEIGIVLIVVLVLFGGAQLPKLARNIGKAQKEFKDGLAEGSKETPTPTPTESSKTDES